jgi:hypothetical protein
MTASPIDTGRCAEYELFEPADEAGARARQQEVDLFLAGKVTNPVYEYPKLDAGLIDDTLDAFYGAMGKTEDPSERVALAGRLAGVAIANSSLMLQVAPSHSMRWYSGQELVRNTEARYGEIRPELFWPVLAERLAIVEGFEPGNLHAEMTKQRLLELVPAVPEGTETCDVLDKELLDAIRPAVLAHVQPLLDVIPEEGKFTSDEITTFANQAIDAVGLRERGWTVVQKQTTKLFSVNSARKEIIVPNPSQDFTKSAADLRRLFPHEIGIHAMKETVLDDEFEEGLGLLVEAVVSGKTDGIAVNRAKNRYLHAGLAMGVDGILRNARQVFEVTWRLEAMKLAKNGIITPEIEAKAKSTMHAHIDNGFRGTDHRLPGVAYIKLKIYLEGIGAAATYAREHRDDPNWLQNVLANGPNR